MNKLEVLENINNLWNGRDVSLYEKIDKISNYFYSSGLDLSGTAAFIKATPAELDSLLSLSELEENIIEKISKINPPKTTWMLFSNASDEEIDEALKALDKSNLQIVEKEANFAISEYVYHKMIEVNGPTIEQKILSISGDDLKHVLKKAEDYNALNDWSKKFLNSISAQKKRGRVLSDKQIEHLIKTLDGLAESGVIKRDSIDGDQEICNRLLDALGK